PTTHTPKPTRVPTGQTPAAPSTPTHRRQHGLQQLRAHGNHRAEHDHQNGLAVALKTSRFH
ncbi:MAG: hypothetical protein ACK6CT_04425, partial [Planctomycetia bacterium]